MYELLAQLEQCYKEYLAEVKKLPGKYPRAAGLLGVGSGPKGDPCHEKFYDDAKSAADLLADVAPDSDTALSAVNLILKAADENKEEEDYTTMMLVAAQALAIPLIEYLTPEDAAELMDWYDKTYPRRTRLPIQKDVGKALKNAAVSRPR